MRCSDITLTSKAHGHVTPAIFHKCVQFTDDGYTEDIGQDAKMFTISLNCQIIENYFGFNISLKSPYLLDRLALLSRALKNNTD